MLKEHFTLLFFLLHINFINSQDLENKFLFVGHPYGSPNIKDKIIVPDLVKFIQEKQDILFDNVVFGGDIVSDCNDEIEVQNALKIIDLYKIKFVIGNHDRCDRMLEIAKKRFGSLNSFEIINNTLILYLNTSINSDEEVRELYDFIKTHININNPEDVIIFSHQLMFSKSDFHVRTNSRELYDYANKLFDKIYNELFNKDFNIHFFNGDIGAFIFTPYAFYDKINNFNFYAVGLGNKFKSKGILIEINNNVKVNFVDLNTSVIEPKEKYMKYKVQAYQLPKLILYYIKKHFIYFLILIIIIIKLLKKLK